MIQKKKFSEAIAANISVVEGLLPLFKAKGSISDNTDLNSITNYGIYGIGSISSIANKPTSEKEGFALLIVYGHSENQRATQIFITSSNGKIYVRQYDGSWGNWNGNY